MGQKPVIAVTTRLELETDRFYLGRHYCEALESFGAIPLLVPLIPDETFLASVAGVVDGLLLPGSDTDVDPLRFGEEPRPGLKKIVPEKENTDLLLLGAAESRRLPVLGICFGMQIMNVAAGGTLYQDISADVAGCVKHEQGVPLGRGSHTVDVERESLLARLITKETKDGNGEAFSGAFGAGTMTPKVGDSDRHAVVVNSHHHQAVRDVGNGFKATAWARDGIVEAIEGTDESRFVLGVQWHPELSWRSDSLSHSIFENFVAACRVKS